MIEWKEIPKKVKQERIEKRKGLMTKAASLATRGMSSPENEKEVRDAARSFRAIADELDRLTPVEIPTKEEYKSQGPPGEDQGVLRE